MGRWAPLVVILSGWLCATAPAAWQDQPNPAPAAGSQQAATPGDIPMGAGPMLGDVPGLTVTTAPPNWITPGLRLTYYTISGFLPYGPHEYTPDPEGGWEDKHGNRYTQHKLEGTGSHGLLQFNVAAMDRQQVAVQTLFYLYDGMDTSSPTQRLETGYVGQAGSGGDLWLHPDALKALLQTYGNRPPPPRGQAGMWISATRKQIEQATYDAVLIALLAESGSRKVWIYDLASGILLYSSEIAKAGMKVVQGAQVHPGGSMTKSTTFKGSRTLSLPWAGQAAPPWLGQARTFRYSGTFQVNIPGSPPSPLAVNATASITGRGPDWVKFDISTGGQAPGISSELTTRVSGNHMLCGSWIPPMAMSNLQAGQVLDTDPFTNVTTQVSSVDPQYVTLVHNNPRQQIQYTYRRQDGLLVRTLLNDRMNQLNMSNQLELSLVSME